MEKLLRINETINAFVWGKYMIALLLFCGIFLMIKSNWLVLRRLKLIYQKTIKTIGKKPKEGITAFQGVATALAGTLGVGSIVGVATAITIGKAGALFWMCFSAFFGMMIKYAEVVLAIHYREKQSDGTYIGGAMTVLEKGCKLPLIGVIFALFCIFASLGIGNLAPVNTIAQSITLYWPVSSVCIGFITLIIVALIIFGKGNKIMRFNEIVIPVVSILYLFACIYLISIHHDRLLTAIKDIFQQAFSWSAGIGGVSGFAVSKAMHYGISRGVFSNEAGMGSSPISHASVTHVNAIEQGFWGIFEVFFDTLVICLLTGLVILCSDAIFQGYDGAALIIKCFEEGFGNLGGIIFAISIIAFAIPSIIGWYYYARECIRYLFKKKLMLRVYQGIFLACLLLGAQMDLKVVWDIADTLNGLMAIPNLISILILHKVVLKLTQEYEYSLKGD